MKSRTSSSSSSSSSSSGSEAGDRDVTSDEKLLQKRSRSSSASSSDSNHSGSDSEKENKDLGSRGRLPSLTSSLSSKSSKSPPQSPKTPPKSVTPTKSPSPTPSSKSEAHSVKSESSSHKSVTPPPKSATPTPRSVTPPLKTPTPPPKSATLPPKTPEASQRPSSRSSQSSSSSSSSSSSESEKEEPTKEEKREIPKIVIPSTKETKTPISSPNRKLSKPGSSDRLKVNSKMKSPSPLNDDVFDSNTRANSRTPKSARFKPSQSSEEPVESELHIMKYRNTRSAPARPRGFYAESSNLAFLKRECDKIERSMKRTAKTSLGRRPKIKPYKPFTWNSLAPYYNTDTLRYMIHMPVTVRRGYNTRATASGMVDPEVSWKMDHCLTPMTPSRPELYRQHYSKRRTQSAMPRLTSEQNVLTPRFPKVTPAAFEEPKRKNSGRNSSLKKVDPVC